MNQLMLRATLAVILAAWNMSAAELRTQHVFHHENVLGTSLELKAYTHSEAVAQAAEAAALAEIDRLAKILSGYDAASEFSRWAKTSQSPVAVSPELFEVLDLFDQWRGRSDGALDASAEAVGRLWKQGAGRQRVPSDEEIAEAITAVRQAHWKLDAAGRTATHLDDTPLRLNSFAKSYIIGRASDAAMRVPGVSAAVVNIGGDLMVRGDLTEAVDITDPRADAENSDPISRLRVRNLAVATSGGYRRGVTIAGQKYSHIVDPRTGRPVDHVLSATVVTPDATDAGALATALCVLTPKEGLRLVATRTGAECLIVMRDGQRMMSPGWQELETPRVQLAAVGELHGLLVAGPAAAADVGRGSKWDSSLELVISFELAHIEAQRAKRPYVAVWIEDQDNIPVRTLALWFAKPKWLPDLRSWNHADKLRMETEATNIVRSVSSATRSPGQYTLKWDGKNNHGQWMKPGKYTVCIEAAREHGTHQVMRQEMEFSGSPKKVELKGNQEISAASLDYHRRTEAP